MILAVDVHYYAESAVVAGVLFSDWKDDNSKQEFCSKVDSIAEYRPGQFYKRELPCILALLEEHKLQPNHIIIDGYVFLDGHSQPGLGKKLYDQLTEKVEIIGVAKNAFAGISDDYAILRGNSHKPLYVTTTHSDITTVKRWINSMHGGYRLPTLLKKVDQLCRKPFAT